MAGFFEKVGDPTFKQFDSKLGGVPSLLVQNYNPSAYDARKAARAVPAPAAPAPTAPKPGTPEWLKWIAAFNQGVVEGVPFVSPVLKKLNLIPESQRKLMEESKKEKPGANILGSIAGGIGATGAVPAAKAVAGGAGLAAKGILPALARGAVNAAPTAIPTAISQAIETGDVDKAAKSGLFTLAGGALTGAAGEALGGLLGKGWKAVRNWLNTKVNAAAGVRSREVMKTASEGLFGKLGVTPGKIDELNEKIADAISRAGGPGKGAIKDFLADQGAIWDDIDRAWQASGKTIDDFLPDVMNHPDVLEALTSNITDPMTGKAYSQYAQDVLTDVVSRTKSADNLASVRKMLWDGMKQGLKRQNTSGHLGTIEADINGALRDAIDNAFVPKNLKAEYPALLVLKKSLAWNEARTLGTAANSATAPRMFLKNLLSGAQQYGPGMALGGLIGATSIDPKDPSSYLPAAGIMAASTVGGAALNKLFAKAATQGTGRLAGLLRNMLPKALPAALERAAPTIGGILGSRGGAAAFNALQRQAAEPEPPAVPAIEGGTEPAETSIERTEASTTPEAKETAKEQVNTAWADRIREKLSSMYDLYIAPQYSGLMSREQFIAAIAQATDNFDPRYTAGAIFPDKQEREHYLRSYESALKLQKINLEEALEGKRGVLGLGGKDTETQIAYDQLRDFAAGLMAEPGKMPEKRVIDQVTAELNAIIGMKIPLARKKQLIRDHLANWGLDLDKLAEYGLGGNTAWA